MVGGRERELADIEEGQSVEVKGSAATPYVLKNTGGIYSCTCPAWRNQSLGIERRTCKHLRAFRGQAAENERVGGAASPSRPKAPAAGGDEAEEGGPPLLLAQRWESDVDLEGWWMSEKLDGVRAWWDGKVFLSRLGNVYHAPDWFLAALPEIPLDGELWGGRGKFQGTVSIVRRQDRSDLWKEISFVVFDAPKAGGPFEARMDLLTRCLGERRAPHARAHEHQVCRGIDHLREELARVESLGGEGLMLRKPGSLYEVGRSATLLKVKSFRDAEARVVEHVKGAGRHRGRLGSLVVELSDGTRFSVGTGLSDAEREDPPPIGSIIGFRYQELSKDGVPRFPSYLGVREDIAFPAAAAAPEALPAEVLVPPKEKGKEAVMAGRRFEFVEGGSSKFWEIEVQGQGHTVRFGRIGTAGQAKTKSFANEAAAQADAEKLIAEKLRKGYAEK